MYEGGDGVYWVVTGICTSQVFNDLDGLVNGMLIKFVYDEE